MTPRKHAVRHTMLVLLALCAPAAARSQELDRSRLEAVADSMARAALQEPNTPGLALAVAVGGEVVLSRGYGMADVELGVPVTPRTVFRIGSITKQFTSSLVMRLVQAGRMSLDDPLTKYLPDYPLQGHHVTIRHLLNHTSGIKSYTGLGDEYWATTFKHDLTDAELIDLFDELPFDFEPGSEYRYNNSAYYILGAVLHAATGEPYPALVQDSLFGPLGLGHTQYCDVEDIIPGRAEGYGYTEDGQLRNDVYLSMNIPGAAGALCSTVLDLVKWTDALSHGRVVTPASYARMTTPTVLTTGDTVPYGFGLGIAELEGHRKIHHGGGINGFASYMAHYPERDLTIVVLTNAETGKPGQIEEALARTVFGLPLLAVKDLPLTDEERERYTGTYELPAVDMELRIFVEDGALMAQAPDQPAFRLRNQGNDTFIPAFDDHVRMVFRRDGGAVTGFVLQQGGASFEARRMD